MITWLKSLLQLRKTTEIGKATEEQPEPTDRQAVTVEASPPPYGEEVTEPRQDETASVDTRKDQAPVQEVITAAADGGSAEQVTDHSLVPSPNRVEETEQSVVPDEVMAEAREVQGEAPKPPLFRKPRVKRPPIEDKRSREPPKAQPKPLPRREEQHIDLGEREAKRSTRRTRTRTEHPRTEKGDLAAGEEEATTRIARVPATRVESPFVELDLDQAKVFLVLPQQRFRVAGDSPNTPSALDYNVSLNGTARTVTTRIGVDELGNAVAEERKLELESPPEEFEIRFPSVLGGPRFEYAHTHPMFYPFVAIGNNRGRLHWVCRRDGTVNALPRKSAWFLMDGKSTTDIEPDATEEAWTWDSHQPRHFDLAQISEFRITNRDTGRHSTIPCSPSFALAGNRCDADDYAEEMPLFAGGAMRLQAPREHPAGWVVWIHNKATGSYILRDRWDGTAPLEIRLPEDLPCTSGEFQLDICDLYKGESEETLFFRYMPLVNIDYPRDVLLPDPKSGHRTVCVHVALGCGTADWVLGCREEFIPEENGWTIDVPPAKDTVCLAIENRDKPGTEVRFRITVGRLRWRLSTQTDWTDTFIDLPVSQLVGGVESALFVRTNLRCRKHELSAALLATNGKVVQEAAFSRTGGTYVLWMNQFYDTVRVSQRDLTLQVAIRDRSTDGEASTADCVRFRNAPAEPMRRRTKERRASVFAVVRRARGAKRIRIGKGFSRFELAEAGVELQKARTLIVPLDRRRKSTHAENVRALKALLLEEGKDDH